MIVLTEQRMQFVEEYLKLRCKNATQAAINAGYSAKSASAQASQILKDTEVSAYLEQRKSEMSRELRQEFIYDALEARKIMYDIMMKEDAADRDKIAVAKDFLDRAGFKPEEHVEIKGNIRDPFEGLTTEELRKLIDDD